MKAKSKFANDGFRVYSLNVTFAKDVGPEYVAVCFFYDAKTPNQNSERAYL
jgi:hypothetical protein